MPTARISYLKTYELFPLSIFEILLFPEMFENCNVSLCNKLERFSIIQSITKYYSCTATAIFSYSSFALMYLLEAELENNIFYISFLNFQ